MQAKEYIKRSRDFYLTLLDKFPALIWRSDINAKCDYFNQTWLEFTGRSMEQELGDGWSEGVHPEDLAGCLRSFHNAFHSRQPFVLEYRLRRYDGEYRWIIDYGRAINDLDGRFVGYLGSCFDTTEAKRTEQTLRESEEKFRQLATNITDVFWMTSPDFNTIHYISPGYELLWGRKVESLYANPRERAEAILPAQRDLVCAAFGSLREKDSMVSIEYQIARPDGTIRWVYDRGFQVRDNAGKLRYLTGIATDITERKRSEESLDLFRRLIDQSNDGFEVIDPKTGRFLDVNGTTCRRLGYQREELLSMSVPEVESTAVDFASWSRNVKEIRRAGFKTIEGRHRRKNGSTFPVEVSARYVSLDRDYLIAAVRDITERKAVEQALKDSQAQRRAYYERIQSIREEESGRIAREIHDELGQALTGLNMDLIWIQEKLEEERSPLLRSQFKRRMKAARKLMEKTLGSVQRIAAELRPAILDELGLTAALGWLAEEFETRTGICCRWKQKPASARSSRDQATALFRIVQEILTNVARHARARSVNLTFAQNDGELILEVADDGKGFDENKLRGHKSLGLLGMRERAALIGAQVEIASAPGKGTKIKVTCPVAEPRKRKKHKRGKSDGKKITNTRRR